MAYKTKVEIMETFEQLLREKKLKDITIKDITDACDLNRKTFYYYFSDIDNLIDDTLSYEVEYYIRHATAEKGERSEVIRFFEMVKQNKEIIYHIYNSTRYEHLVSFTEGKLYFAVRQIANGFKKNYDISDAQLDLITEAYTAIVSDFIMKWVDEGMEKDINELVDDTYNITKGIMEFMINNVVEANKNKN